MPDRSRKTRKDANQMAKAIVDRATKRDPPEVEHEKDPAAVALGRRGGLKGGKARAASLSDKQRTEIARRAAEARWRAKD